MAKLAVLIPVMLRANKFGYITHIRIVRLLIETSYAEAEGPGGSDYNASRGDKNANVLVQNRCFQEYYTLKIDRVLEKHVHMISTENPGRWLNVCRYLCKGVDYSDTIQRGLRYINKMPVELADGTIQRGTDWFAPVASIASSNVFNAKPVIDNMYFFDYKGNMYTAAELTTRYTWAKFEITALCDKEISAPRHMMYGFARGYCSYMRYDCRVYALPNFTATGKEARAKVVAHALMGNADIKISGDAAIIECNETQGCIDIPIQFNYAIVKSKNKQGIVIHGESTVVSISMTSFCLPLFEGIEKVYGLNLVCDKSTRPFVIPHVVNRPASYADECEIRLIHPYFEQLVDYSAFVYDSIKLEILMGWQQSRQVILPALEYVEYCATLATGSFALKFAAGKDVRLHTRTRLGTALCVLGLYIDSAVVPNVLLDFRNFDKRNITAVMQSRHELCTEQTAVNIMTGKDTTELVLTYTNEMNVTVAGGEIQRLCITQTWLNADNCSALHVYADVKELQLYLTLSAARQAQMPIYMHGNVQKVCVFVASTVITGTGHVHVLRNIQPNVYTKANIYTCQRCVVRKIPWNDNVTCIEKRELQFYPMQSENLKMVVTRDL